MNSFEKLKEICDRLRSPEGCPWYNQQTFQSLCPHLLEETHELIEAVDEDDTSKIIEEVGDLLFGMVFMAKLGEVDGRFTLNEVIEAAREKMVRRHPHVFEDLSIKDVDELAIHWERMKKIEKPQRKHELEGIPKTLGALSRAQKVIEKMMRKSIPLFEKGKSVEKEESIGDQFLELVAKSCRENVDAEGAVRRALKKLERAFVDSEKGQVDRVRGKQTT